MPPGSAVVALDFDAVSIHRSTGSGAFEGPWRFTLAPIYPVDLAVASLDGDARPDLVAANAAFYDSVTVLLSGRHPAFYGPPKTYTTGPDPLVVAAGDAWDPHHVAALFGYGAEAVHPWLALESAGALSLEGAPSHELRARLRAALEKGLLKILSKMGIATLSSYAGAQIFEALGVGHEVIDRCFTGTASVIGGIGFTDIAQDVLARHRVAYPEGAAPTGLVDQGRIRYRKDGEDHGWSPTVVRALQHGEYSGFADGVRGRAPAGPRDLLDFRKQTPIPLAEVEPAEEIRRRFISSAMSLGALSPEAHATLAVAMNRMHARSNSGEGGEDPGTYVARADGDRADNRIKQVASGRFGVTTAYLVRADELEINIASTTDWPMEWRLLAGYFRATEKLREQEAAVKV